MKEGRGAAALKHMEVVKTRERMQKLTVVLFRAMRGRSVVEPSKSIQECKVSNILALLCREKKPVLAEQLSKAVSALAKDTLDALAHCFA